MAQPMFEPWLQFFDPDSEELLDRLLPQIDDWMILEVASADYGQEAEKHLAPLKQFRDSRELPLLEWHPAEVLELIRWSQPDDPDWKPGGQGAYGHLLRAFACSTLLRSYERPENKLRWHSFNETAVQLADSLRALDGELVPSGVKFLAWCVGRLAPLHEDGFEGPFLGIALLTLALRIPTIGDDPIVGLCRWIDAEVQSLLPEHQWRATRKMDWLLSMNYHDLKNSRWIGLGRELYEWAEAQPESDKATWVALIGRSLAED